MTGLAGCSDDPENVGTVICNNQIYGITVKPLKDLESFAVLGSLDDETEVPQNTLTKNSGIVPSVTRST
jgi:hypothetical protein